ncbi:MAG TPA: type II toxin-antitoxin system RelE/ParE family toxin [Hymenobacter sp.]
MNVIWSPRANREFIKQAQWLEQSRGNQAVLQYYDEVEKAIKRISMPDFVLYRAVANNPGLHCYPFNRFTELYYRLGAGQVELVCFFDNRQDPKNRGF